MTRHLGRHVARERRAEPAGQLDDLQATGHLGQRVRVDLALLGGDQRGEVVAVRVQQGAVAEEDRGPLSERGPAPGGEGLLRRGDRRVDLVGAGQRYPRGDLSGRGVGHGSPGAGRARKVSAGLSRDPVGDGLHRQDSFEGDGAGPRGSCRRTSGTSAAPGAGHVFGQGHVPPWPSGRNCCCQERMARCCELWQIRGPGREVPPSCPALWWRGSLDAERQTCGSSRSVSRGSEIERLSHRASGPSVPGAGPNAKRSMCAMRRLHQDMIDMGAATRP